ncbi:MAG TPA: hypothetical protein VNP92_12765 [Actinophytocola sp.]|nr:hypothetical protein [Actinophytocola sp.]
MNEHRLHHSPSFNNRTVARRRRVHAARLRMAGMRARMAEAPPPTTAPVLSVAEDDNAGEGVGV